jgi:hypothetical protein
VYASQERTDIGRFGPLMHSVHEAQCDLLAKIELNGGPRGLDLNFLCHPTYVRGLTRAGVEGLPPVKLSEFYLSPSQLGRAPNAPLPLCASPPSALRIAAGLIPPPHPCTGLHSFAIAGGADPELLSYYSMEQLREYESRGSAIRGGQPPQLAVPPKAASPPPAVIASSQIYSGEY